MESTADKPRFRCFNASTTVMTVVPFQPERKMRILLVEDDLMIGDAIQSALNDASYATDWVKNGLTALSALDTQAYDLLLLDLGLPGKDGLDVLDAIRARNNPVPLLIITARDGLDDRLRGLDGGADDFLLKPSSWRNCWHACGPYCAVAAAMPNRYWITVRYRWTWSLNKPRPRTPLTSSFPVASSRCCRLC
jgi:CheY-like chemotaxis protein